MKHKLLLIIFLLAFSNLALADWELDNGFVLLTGNNNITYEIDTIDTFECENWEITDTCVYIYGGYYESDLCFNSSDNVTIGINEAYIEDSIKQDSYLFNIFLLILIWLIIFIIGIFINNKVILILDSFFGFFVTLNYYHIDNIGIVVILFGVINSIIMYKVLKSDK